MIGEILTITDYNLFSYADKLKQFNILLKWASIFGAICCPKMSNTYGSFPVSSGEGTSYILDLVANEAPLHSRLL